MYTTVIMQFNLTTFQRKTAVKPTQSLSPKMISLKKIGDTPDCPVPDVGIKSLAGDLCVSLFIYLIIIYDDVQNV